MTERYQGVVEQWQRRKDRRTTSARDVRRISVLHAPPASIAELVAYTKSGAWVPGERAPVLEWFGKAYGYVIAVPASCGLYVAAWLLQRPTRLFLTVAVGAVMWFTR